MKSLQIFKSAALKSVITATAIGGILMTSPAAQALEQPQYTVIQKSELYEIRKYEPYIVAEVVVPGPESEAGGQAFSLLGGYIFGKNKGERKLEMTAPVVQTPVAAPASSTKIEMTAPVVQTPTQNGFLVQFMMPSATR
jgi:SOUL heme-binding protein